MPHDSSAPPAASPADSSLSAVLSAVSRMAEQQQSLLELLRSGASPGAPKPAASSDELRTLVKGLFQEHQAAATRSAARDAYLREHVSDLPEAYRRLLPQTDDATALSAAEQEIRRQFREDLKSILRTPADAGAASASSAAASRGSQSIGGAPPAAAMDFSKLSPLQQIAVGLRQKAAERVIPKRAKPVLDVEPAAYEDPSPADEPDDALFVGAD